MSDAKKTELRKDLSIKTEATSDVKINILDLRTHSSEVELFVNSHLRAAGEGNTFSTRDYDLSKVEFLENKDGVGVYSSRSKTSKNESLVFLKYNNAVQAVNIVRVVNEDEKSIYMECISSLDGTPLMRGHIDKNSSQFHITYMDSKIKSSDLRASAAGLLCNLSMYGAGASWAYCLSLISGGASFAFGLAWTIASYYVCDPV